VNAAVELGAVRIAFHTDSMLKAFVKSRLSRNVSRAARHLADEWQVHRVHLKSVKRARSLSSFPVQLNLGSGFNPKPGWINVDLGHETADLQLDLREPLPFPNEYRSAGSTANISSSTWNMPA
jgi:hypothetical protein